MVLEIRDVCLNLSAPIIKNNIIDNFQNGICVDNMLLITLYNTMIYGVLVEVSIVEVLYHH